MRVAITGATGLIGSRLVERLLGRGDQVTVLSRDPRRARSSLGAVEAVAWDPVAAPAPAEALAGCEGVVHLAGENVAQRWSAESKRRIRDSRVVGTGNLVQGLRAAEPPPAVLVSASAIGYYGAHDDERVDESAAPGQDFLARVCVEWEEAAIRAAGLGMRVVLVRTGVVLDRHGGALARMLPPFRAGIGGPVAGGRQYVPWIHADDLAGIYLAALDGGEDWSGPVNATAPEPVTNRELSRALGRVLRRPAVAPVPAFALRLLYGGMAQIVTEGARVVPARATQLGYSFTHRELEPALRAALDRD
jgi:uncharacterized protein (TIGR01777 family)